MLGLPAVGWFLSIGVGAGAIAQPASSEPMLHMIPMAQRSPDRPVLQLGSEGAAVRELQAVLSLMGYYGGEIDGRYQESTAIAVSMFQESAGLPVDGVMGPNTWSALLPSVEAVRSASEPTAAVPSDSSETPNSSSGFPTPSMLNPDPTAPASTEAPTTATDPSSADPPSATMAGMSDDTRAEETTADLPVLRLGMRGFAVERLQERLQILGFYAGAIDGIFGPATEAAVQAMQRANALNPDGIVGAATWTVLFQ